MMHAPIYKEKTHLKPGTLVTIIMAAALSVIVFWAPLAWWLLS